MIRNAFKPPLLLSLLLSLGSCTLLNSTHKRAFAPMPRFDKNLTLAQNTTYSELKPSDSAALVLREAEVEKALNKQGYLSTETVEGGRATAITLPMAELFSPNDTLLSPQGEALLAPLASFAHPTKPYALALATHSDNRGSETYLHCLTQKRAEAIYQCLASEGVDTTNIACYARGGSEPLLPNNSLANREKNRRVVLYLIALPEAIYPTER